MKSKTIKQNIIVFFMVVTLLLFMTIGYASFNEELDLAANVKLINDLNSEDIILETNYKYVNSINDKDLVISVSIEDESATNTSIKVINNSDDMFTYVGNKALYDKSLYPNITGILPGDYLLPNEEKVIYVKNLDDTAIGNMLIDFQFTKYAVAVPKSIIITSVLDPVIHLVDNNGLIEISVLNQYDSSIELEFYFNDEDLDVSLEKKRLYLNKGDSKKFILNIESTSNIESDLKTILCARVFSNISSDDFYVLENITITKDV